ncbi:TrbI/VirB10 family protein [Elusimicrobiota bacterium]
MVRVVLIFMAWSAFAQDTTQIESARFLPTGTQIKATVTNAIFSYNLEVPVIAELESEAKYCDPTDPKICRPVVFPSKTKLIGRALILKSNNRVNVDFHLAVLPDGTEVAISAIALSPDGSAGIRGKVKKHKDSLVASAALKGAIAGAARVAGTAANPVTGEATNELADVAIEEIDFSREKVDTSIEVPAFTRCLVYLLSRIEIPEKNTKLPDVFNKEKL